MDNAEILVSPHYGGQLYRRLLQSGASPLNENSRSNCVDCCLSEASSFDSAFNYPEPYIEFTPDQPTGCPASSSAPKIEEASCDLILNPLPGPPKYHSESQSKPNLGAALTKKSKALPISKSKLGQRCNLSGNGQSNGSNNSKARTNAKLKRHKVQKGSKQCPDQKHKNKCPRRARSKARCKWQHGVAEQQQDTHKRMKIANIMSVVTFSLIYRLKPSRPLLPILGNGRERRRY